MAVPTDLREFIESLNSHGVEYLVVGAHALAFHGRPRYIGDIDLLLRPESIVQLGVAPNRIDLLTSLTGVTFM